MLVFLFDALVWVQVCKDWVKEFTQRWHALLLLAQGGTQTLVDSLAPAVSVQLFRLNQCLSLRLLAI